MISFIKRFPVHVLLLMSCGLVAILGFQNRKLDQRANDYARRIVFPAVGRFVPEFPATDLAGAGVRIGAPTKSAQVLIFFTTTCPFCRESLPFWKQLMNRIETDAGLSAHTDMLGISFDSLAATAKYAKDHELSFRTALFPVKQQRLYNVRSVPQLMVINRDGLIVYTRAGVLNSGVQLDSVIQGVRTALASNADQIPPPAYRKEP